MATQKFFVTLWEGNIAPHDIVVNITSNSLVRTAESESWIEKEWQKLLKGGFKAWPNDTNSTRYRFCEVRKEGSKLIVMLDPCVSYRDFIGSNSPEFLERFGEACNPHPLAVSVVVVTSDRKIMLTVRKNVDYKSGGYHASIGGFLDIRKENEPVSAMYREIKEECGIESNELENVRCVSIAHNPWTLHSDIIFIAETGVESREIQKRTKDDENESLFFIPATRLAIEDLIRKTSHANVIIAMVGLLLLGRCLPPKTSECESQDEWYERMLLVLAEESKDYDLPLERLRLERRDISRFQKMIRGA